MDMQQAIAKAAKLLRLAKSDNPNEAALAASMAQDIIDRYKLTGVNLELDSSRKVEEEEPIREFQEPLEDGGRKLASWKFRLAFTLSRANQCKVFTRGSNIQLVGRPSDAEAVRYLFSFLSNEIDRLTQRDGYGNGRTWCNNFRFGCVDTISQKLAEQHKATVASVQQEAAANPSAIVLVNNALARVEERAKSVELFVKKNYKLRSRGGGYARGNQDARAAGRKAAQEISIGGGRGLGGGSRGQLGA